MRFFSRLLCWFGWHRWLLAYQDEQEVIYSCRRDHGADLCPAMYAIPMTSNAAK